VRIRAKAAVGEILSAIGPEGSAQYASVLDSSPEGPDGEDEWTKESEPLGGARRVLDKFVAFYRGRASREDGTPAAGHE
jgi:hypothetical protein